MTTDRGKRYIPPPTGDVLPTSFYCVPVRVPANVHYLRCFLHSLDYFGKWVAWENADGVQATEIAALWKQANDLTRALMVDGGCYSLEPQYDADLPDGRRPVLGTIDDFLWYLRNIGSDMITRLGNAEDCADIVDYWKARLLDQLEVLATSQLENLCTALSGMSQQQQTNFLDIAHWQAIREEMYCRYINQEITYEEYNNFLEWLSDQISISLNAASEWLIDTLNDVAEIITGTNGTGIDRAARVSAGSGGGFGGTTVICEWAVDVDFTVTADGWVSIEGVPPNLVHATWYNGVGWQYDAGQQPLTGMSNVMAIQKTFDPPVEFTQIAATCHRIGVGNGTNTVAISSPGYSDLLSYSNNPNTGVTDHTHTHNFGSPTELTSIVLRGQSDAPDGGTYADGTPILVSAHFEGIGPNPWA